MKQIHIRRFLSLLLAALTLWAAAVTAGSDSAAAALQQLRQGSRLPQQALRWELGDFFGLDSLSAVTVMTLAQSPLLLAGRSTVAALLSAGVTRDPPEPAAPESPNTPSPSADPSLTDGLTFADNGVPAQTTAPTSSKGYTVVNGVYLKNSSGTELDADALSDGSFAAQLTDDGPQVLIVHSHGSEAYTMPAGQEYTPTGSFRTDNDACNVVRVGDEIAAALSERGISVLHDRTLHDVPDYNDAYPHSLASVEDYMEKYPSLAFVLDVHRDAVSDADGNQYKLVSAEEPHAAQMSFIMGNAYDGWQENLKLAIAIQQNLSADYPTLMRPITVLNYRYNQFVSPGAMLLEVGAAGNSLDEALYNDRRSWFAFWVAVNLVNNYFFFIGQVVFLAIYFICKLSTRDFRLTAEKFGLLAFESLLGAAMGSILLVPAVLSILQNPRTIDLSSGWGFLTYSKVQQYLAILVSWIMPPDSPYLTSIWSEGVIKWTSMSAYLPLCSLAGAVAYWKAKRGDSKKRIVGTCAVFALVPILNSAFYALNSSYYARWYYMPVLVLAAMTVNALEDHNTDLDSPARGISWLMIATVAFAVVPVQDSDTGSWSFGVLKNPGQYCAVLGFGLLGLLLYRYLCQKWRGDSRFAQRMTAAVLAFAFLFSVVHIGIGKFGQWYTDSDLVKQDTNALLLKNDLPEGDYRVDTYKIHDNIGMWLDKSCLQYFGSTAAPSILSFYPALGVKRDVRSEPELSNYALRGLLSVEYLITTPEKQTDFENEADDGWEYAFAKDGYAVYRNTNYVPMGFAYDYYLTQTEYEETAKATRANLLMRALVLTDEDAAVYGKYLTHLPEGRREELYYESYVQDCRERRATAASVFQMNNSGFHAEITLEKENLVFFSVPYDDGFTAYVNGQEADIVEVDEGLMAVLCPAGENSIDFVYQPDGIRLSRALTLGGIVVWLAYTAYFVWRKRRTKRA